MKNGGEKKFDLKEKNLGRRELGLSQTAIY